RQGKDSNNLAEGFRISGLGQLIEAGIQSERFVVFGD
ncbi:sulfur relay protein TusD/DsrE, partial [Candidatus Thiomargarita nelsonii]